MFDVAYYIQEDKVARARASRPRGPRTQYDGSLRDAEPMVNAWLELREGISLITLRMPVRTPSCAGNDIVNMHVTFANAYRYREGLLACL